MNIEEAIREKVRKLPPEKQSEVPDFTEFLQARCAQSASPSKSPQKGRRGLWADLSFSVSEEDIKLRNEMWHALPRKDT